MTTSQPGTRPQTGPRTAPDIGGARPGRYLVPTATLVVGVVAGAVGHGWATGSTVPLTPSNESSPTPTVTVTRAAAPRPGDTVVPAECLRLADRADESLALLRRAAEDAGRFDAASLAGAVREALARPGAMRTTTTMPDPTHPLEEETR